MDQLLSIRDVSARTGLSVHTLRYYERAGLLDPVGRAACGHRRYAPADIAWIEFLSRLRATGMPIRQMQQFAHLRRRGAQTVGDRRELLEAHRLAVQTHLATLQHSLAEIEEKIRHYRRLEEDADDPIAGAFTIADSRGEPALSARVGEAGGG